MLKISFTMALPILLANSVVAYAIILLSGRLPFYLARQWRQQCLVWLSEKHHNNILSEQQQPKPIILPGYLMWLITGLCTLLTISVLWSFQLSWQTVFTLFFVWGLLALSLIDCQHHFLPDGLIYALLWLGLYGNTYAYFANIQDAIIGVIAGYGFSWLLHAGLQHHYRREMMGHGDVKFMSMLGAWFGWQYLPILALQGCLLAGLYAITLYLYQCCWKHPYDRSIVSLPFAPFLACSSWVTLLCLKYYPWYVQ